MIFELTQNFHDAVAAMPPEHAKRRMLDLLEEAIRRDIHFIDRHPTTLFQCMWNTCWWYDNIEAAKHFTNLDKIGRLGFKFPWEHNETNLHSWMKGWRDAKEKATPGFRWLRSLRPPLRNLGAGSSMLLPGHEAHPTGLNVTDDGSIMGSVDLKGNLHLWDTNNFHEIARVQVCQGDNVQGAEGVLFGPAKSWIATWGKNGQHGKYCLRLYDFESLKIISESELKSWISGMVYLPKKKIICGVLSIDLVCWDPEENLKVIERIDTGYKDVQCITAGPDDKVWMGTREGDILTWDGKTAPHLCLRDDAPVTSLAIHKDGDMLAWGTESGRVKVWSLDAKKELVNIHGHDGTAKVVIFVDSDHISSMGKDVVRYYDISGHKSVTSYQLERYHMTDIVALDGEIIIAAWPRAIRVWRPLPRPAEPLFSMHNPEGSLLFAQFGHRRNSLKTIGWGKKMQTWDVRTGCLESQANYHGSRWALRSHSQYAVSRSFQAAWGEYETAIEKKYAETPVAWWPETLFVAMYPSDSIWGGGTGNHVHILRLEGGSGKWGSLFRYFAEWISNKLR